MRNRNSAKPEWMFKFCSAISPLEFDMHVLTIGTKPQIHDVKTSLSVARAECISDQRHRTMFTPTHALKSFFYLQETSKYLQTLNRMSDQVHIVWMREHLHASVWIRLNGIHLQESKAFNAKPISIIRECCRSLCKFFPLSFNQAHGFELEYAWLHHTMHNVNGKDLWNYDKLMWSCRHTVVASSWCSRETSAAFNVCTRGNTFLMFFQWKMNDGP